LDSTIKAGTFAAALREKHVSNTGQKERNYFSGKFGRLEKSITFAAALREKL
jgi:hypothetical protein